MVARVNSSVEGNMAKRRVKVVRITHGLLGRPNNYRIERAIQKWVSKGYELKSTQDEKGGCISFGYTLLTFIEAQA
jgi:hypothetical protein